MQTHLFSSDCGKHIKREESPYQEAIEEEKSSMAEKVLNSRGVSLEKNHHLHQNHQATEEAKASAHQLFTPIYNNRQIAMSS